MARQSFWNTHVAAQIVVSPDGVEFPDGLLAKVVVCIATINRYSHWGTLFNVYRYLSDPKHVCQIKAECSADLMNPVIILITVAIYVVFFVGFKKNKVRFQDYLEFLATGKRPDHGEAKVAAA